MSIDRVDASPSFDQTQKLAQRKREIEDQETGLIKEKSRLEAERKKILSSEEEKNDQTRVTISSEGEKQSELLRSANKARIVALSQSQDQNFQNVAKTTAEQIRNLDADSVKKISDFRLSTMEKFKQASDQAEDPFYRMQTLHPVLSEKEQEFQVKITLPEHEAKNLFISSDDNKTIKLSLARSFQNMEATAPNEKTRTSNYQTILESLSTPGAFDPRRVRREYADGVLTVFLPKA